jgi:signal transduction histidine kinase
MAQSRSLLIVEDDPDMRLLLETSLTSEGYRISGCANGVEALAHLRSGSVQVDAIVLDLMMPVMDGWQFRIHQKQDPSLALIPVVALSADATPKAAAIDAAAYLQKPVSHETLIATIERVMLGLERRKLEAQLAQMDRLTSLGTLVAGIAHEINNPLTYITANLELVIERVGRLRSQAPSPTVEEIEHLMHDVRVGAERVRRIVRDLRTLSRADAEIRVPLEVRPILDQSIRMTLNEIRYRARVVEDHGTLPLVEGDEARLSQIFVNLLLNAAQAIPEGRPEENEIGVATRTDPLGRAVIEVRDTGRGISPDALPRIFDPFFTTKKVGQGTGLGLSICHGIVTSMGGTMEVRSEMGRGSVFQVVLPAARKDTVPAEGPALSVQREATRRGRVLIVDDDPMVGRTLRRILETEHDVTLVTEAQAALTLLRGDGARFDAILCDLMMPQMSGMELYAELSRVQVESVARIVFLTGGAFTQTARSFLDSIPNRWFEKPVGVAELREVVCRLVRDAQVPPVART